MNVFRLLFFILPIFFIFACSSEDDSIPESQENEPEPEALRLIQTKFSNEDGSHASYTDYTYNSNGFLVREERSGDYLINFIIDYHYENGIVTGYTEARDGNEANDYTFEYENGRIIKDIDPNNNYTEFFYDNLGRLIRNKSGSQDCGIVYEYFGNTTNFKSLYYECFEDLLLYEYDNAINPRYSQLPEPVRPLKYITENNQTQFELENSTLSYTTEYQYNEQGLPVSAMSIDHNGNIFREIFSYESY